MPAKLIKQNFPNLTVCEIVDLSSPIRESLHSHQFLEKTCDPWVKWLKKNTLTSWLRVRINKNKDLIFRKLNSTQYLMVLNETENLPLLISFIKTMSIMVPDYDPEASQSSHSSEGVDAKLHDAIRIQKMIIPNEEHIRERFKQFFVVHKQQDVVGGDLYWFAETKNCTLLALVDCTGHSIEGAMTSMVCNSLLNQARERFDPTIFTAFVSEFYMSLSKYNQTAGDALEYGNYGIGAEVGVFCFNHDTKEISFVSTGISAFVKRKEGLELIKCRKVRDFGEADLNLKEIKIPMEGVLGLYTFTDGLVDQFDAKDKKKLGLKGVKSIIENEKDFHEGYYSDELTKWMGSNMQYDDITLLGIAI